REEAGTVGLSGRDLPAAEALAGHANVMARARVYEISGAFPGRDTGWLQAQAYLDLLGGVPATDRIAFAATASAEPPDEPGPGAANPGDDGGPFGGDDDDSDGPEPGLCEDGGSGRDEPGPRGSDGASPARGDGEDPAGDADDISDSPDPDDEDVPELDGDGDSSDWADGDVSGANPGGDGGDESPREPEAIEAQAPPLIELTVPLATLQGKAERAGDNRLLGPLDPALARQLAAAAARSPHSRWEVIVVDEHGYAIGHGIARRARGSPGGPRPPEPGPGSEPALGALPARVNITVTQTLLRLLATRAAQPRAGAPPGDWELTPGKPGTWTLFLPGGRELIVRFDLVPTHDCDHRYQTSAYEPGDRLRRLVQVRDHQCTFPTCSRAARESDFEHAIPYDKGGRTDACNAGARSRRCHGVKQSPGWTVTQPKPGWHQWTTPTGRTYTQEPWRYIA
ncbi:MAG TPA: hypothetical protein VMI73_18490, partial [Trebonia sp.]|nr:hypothetical protein [Trebonia sp.]